MLFPVPGLDEVTAERITRLEVDADAIFGPDTRAMRFVLGVAIGHLIQRGGVGGVNKTREYISRQLAELGHLDLAGGSDY